MCCVPKRHAPKQNKTRHHDDDCTTVLAHARVSEPPTTTTTTMTAAMTAMTARVVTSATASRLPAKRGTRARANAGASRGEPAGEGYLPGTMASAEEILDVVIDRRSFKPTSEACPFCVEAMVKENGSKCIGVCRNPQNVPGPIFQPHAMQTVEDVVTLIITAMRDKDVPRRDHGVQVLWEYAVEHGNMERSRFFGYSSDMYHFDHFIGKALSTYDQFVYNTGHTIKTVSTMSDGRTRVDVDLFDRVGAKSEWIFIMVKRTFGKYEGCIQAHRIVKSDFPRLEEI